MASLYGGGNVARIKYSRSINNGSKDLVVFGSPLHSPMVVDVFPFSHRFRADDRAAYMRRGIIDSLYIGAAGQVTVYLGNVAATAKYLGTKTFFP